MFDDHENNCEDNMTRKIVKIKVMMKIPNDNDNNVN